MLRFLVCSCLLACSFLAPCLLLLAPCSLLAPCLLACLFCPTVHVADPPREQLSIPHCGLLHRDGPQLYRTDDSFLLDCLHAFLIVLPCCFFPAGSAKRFTPTHAKLPNLIVVQPHNTKKPNTDKTRSPHTTN